MDPEGEFNLEDMTEDEKDQLIIRLGMAYNSKLLLAADLYNCMTILSAEIANGNVLGQRGETMSSVHTRMEIILAMCLPMFGIDMEQVKTDSVFEDIISQLEDDNE